MGCDGLLSIIDHACVRICGTACPSSPLMGETYHGVSYKYENNLLSVSAQAPCRPFPAVFRTECTSNVVAVILSFELSDSDSVRLWVMVFLLLQVRAFGRASRQPNRPMETACRCAFSPHKTGFRGLRLCGGFSFRVLGFRAFGLTACGTWKRCTRDFARCAQDG